jgi:hypothetical protein
MLRATIFWVGLVVIGFALWGGVELLSLPARAAADRLSTAETRLANLDRQHATLVAELGKYPSGDVSADPRIDRDGDASTALQRFQERVRDELLGAGGTPVVTQTANEMSGGLATLTMLMRFTIAETGLMSFLQQLESGAPAIVVSELEFAPSAQPETGLLDVSATLKLLHADAL